MAAPYNDPLAFVALPFVEEYVKPLVPQTALQNHIHELVLVIAVYHSIFMLSYVFSPILFPQQFKSVPYKTRIDFHIHVVSMIQSVVIMGLIYPLLSQPEPSTPQDRVFLYTPYQGFVTVMALGYFIWDAIVSLVYVKYFGVGFLMHGIVSSIVFYIGIEPFISYYAAVFILFELSTPFLNIRWLGIRFPSLLSENFKLVNNAILILIFFFVRICYGWTKAYELASDFISVKDDDRFIPSYAVIIMSGNMVLNVLNLFWFYRMVKVAYAILSDMIMGKDEHDEAKKDI